MSTMPDSTEIDILTGYNYTNIERYANLILKDAQVLACPSTTFHMRAIKVAGLIPEDSCFAY